MKIKTGDKVKFLNEKGEGIVTKVKGNIVFVEIEEGFDLPFEINQVIKIDAPHSKGEITKEIISAPFAEKKMEEEEDNLDWDEELVDSESIYLAFVPENVNNLFESDLLMNLVNDCSYNTYYSCSFKKQHSYVLIKSGFLRSKEKCSLIKIERNDVDTYSTLKVDLLFLKDKDSEPLSPVSEMIKLRPVKFYKESSYTVNCFFSSKAHLIRVYSKSENAIPFSHSPESLKNIFLQKEKKEKGKISKPNEGLIEAEIDLHIEELIDNIRGLSNAAIVNIQLNHFRAALENAISTGVKRLIVIHGVGNGRLKEEVRKVLKTYDGISYRDGSYARFGFGATEVSIH